MVEIKRMKSNPKCVGKVTIKSYNRRGSRMQIDGQTFKISKILHTPKT